MTGAQVHHLTMQAMLDGTVTGEEASRILFEAGPGEPSGQCCRAVQGPCHA
jgi:hypothetical protein